MNLVKGAGIRFFVKHSQTSDLFQTAAYQKVIKVVKPLLALILIAFLVYKLLVSYRMDELLIQVQREQTLGPVWYLVLSFLFMFFNWGLETVKWRFLISKFEPVTFGKSLKAVLSGVTLSVLTPNQIGDFAGRVVHLEFMDKWRGSLTTVIGHFAQVLVTIAFGLFALNALAPVIGYSDGWFPAAVVLALLLILVYFQLGEIYHRVGTWQKFSKLNFYLNVFGYFNRGELGWVLLLSLLRYLVFLLQYFFLLHFFGVEIPVKYAIAGIVATFCVQSVVPSFLLIEMGLRGVSALFFFSFFSNNTVGILLSAYSLWVVNMLLPALLGMYYLYRLKS